MLWIRMRMHEVCSCGFPHSDTRGSSGICPSPRLFAACRVLLRLPVPRHPPRALLRLTVPCALRALRAFLVHCLCTSTVRCCFPAARPPACRSVAPLLPAAPRGSRRSRAAFTDFVACFFCCLDSPPHGGSSDVFLSFAWLPPPPVPGLRPSQPSGKACYKNCICGFQGAPAHLPCHLYGERPSACHPLFNSGGRLLSRTVSSAVPSAVRALTVVFGMGTGVSPGRIAARSLSAIDRWTAKHIFLYFFFLRKEVIQPHLPIRLPCYDFTPVIGPTFGSSPLAVGPLTSGVADSHGVTGGVYKTRERIHRGVLIRDY